MTSVANLSGFAVSNWRFELSTGRAWESVRSSLEHSPQFFIGKERAQQLGCRR